MTASRLSPVSRFHAGALRRHGYVLLWSLRMPRGARVRVAGLPVHVIQRGNNRGACFVTDADRRFYLTTLSVLAGKFSCAIHAYVLMTNHVHVLMTPHAADGASLVMKHLGVRYVQYFNRLHDRTGALWEGRFRSSVVDTDSYFLTCQRYIEANPVRAAMVRHPAEFRWSSYRFNAFGGPDSLVTPHGVYLGLGKDQATRRAAYRALFDTPLEEATLASIRAAANAGHVLGSEQFRSDLAHALGRRVTPGRKGRPARSDALSY